MIYPMKSMNTAYFIGTASNIVCATLEVRGTDISVTCITQWWGEGETQISLLFIRWRTRVFFSNIQQ